MKYAMIISKDLGYIAFIRCTPKNNPYIEMYKDSSDKANYIVVYFHASDDIEAVATIERSMKSRHESLVRALLEDDIFEDDTVEDDTE